MRVSTRLQEVSLAGKLVGMAVKSFPKVIWWLLKANTVSGIRDCVSDLT